jgi:hypothetical protein
VPHLDVFLLPMLFASDVLRKIVFCLRTFYEIILLEINLAFDFSISSIAHNL